MTRKQRARIHISRLYWYLRAATQIRPSQINSKQLIFIADRPKSREAKLSAAMRARGWEVILLHREPLPSLLKQYFDQTIQYHLNWELLALCKRYSPVAFHIFCLFEYENAEFILKHRPGKIVIDPYDVLNAYATSAGFTPAVLNRERYCLTEADAICARSLELQHVKRQLGKRPLNKIIFFTDYCWAKDKIPLRTGKTKKPKFVLAGGIPIEAGEPGYESQIQLIRELSSRGLRFEIYAALAKPFGKPFENAYRSYLDLQNETTGMFKIHPPVPVAQLVETLSHFDVGFAIYTEYRPDETHHISDHSLSRYKYCHSQRVFDYIDAGLPVTANYSKFTAWIIRHYGCWVDPDPYVYSRTNLPELDMGRLQENVIKTRQRLSLRENSARLEKFYLALHE